MQSSSHQRCCGTAVRLVCEQLGVICVEVMAYAEAVNRICHVLCIDCELMSTDPLALQNTTRQTNWPELVSGVLNVCECPVW